MMAVAATGSNVLNAPVLFRSSKDSIGTGKVSTVIPLTPLLLQPATKRERYHISISHPGSTAPLKNVTMPFSLQYCS